MVLIDALYINNGGGKILLDYLVCELEKSGKEVFYLLDKRVENKVPEIKTNKVAFLKYAFNQETIFIKIISIVLVLFYVLGICRQTLEPLRKFIHIFISYCICICLKI